MDREHVCRRSARIASLLVACWMFGSPVPAGEIHDAAREGNADLIRDICSQHPDLVEERTAQGSTPLAVAASGGHLAAVELLLKLGADVNAANRIGYTPLHYAAHLGHAEITRRLIAAGADLLAQSGRGGQPLHSAVHGGQAETVDILLAAGADPTATNSEGGGLIHLAAAGGQAAMIDRLLDEGFDIHARTDDQSTPLHWAAWLGREEAVAQLLRRGADVTLLDTRGATALHGAAANGQAGVLRVMMEAGIDPDLLNRRGDTPLLFCSYGGDADCARILLDAGADPDRHAGASEAPLAAAASRGHADLVQLLVVRGADVNAADSMGTTPLHQAAVQGEHEICRVLLEKGARVDARERIWGRAPIHWAAIKGNAELTALLLEHGASWQGRDKEDQTPLHYAARYGHPVVASLLQARGARADDLIERSGPAPELTRALEEGEAVLWYLGHCGWAIKTRHRLLVFDYWNTGRDPARPCLANGHIDPMEIRDVPTTVFITHEHQDHYDPVIHGWADTVRDLTYVYGFRPEELPQNRESGYTGPAYTFMPPHETRTIDGMRVTTIEANDAGVGYLVEVDGLVLYHAGDHAGWLPNERDGYIREIDYLDERIDRLDVAFVNITGCHAHDPAALAEGNRYKIERLAPRVVVPTHAGDREHLYVEFAREAQVETACPLCRGDVFHYRDRAMRSLSLAGTRSAESISSEG